MHMHGWSLIGGWPGKEQRYSCHTRRASFVYIKVQASQGGTLHSRQPITAQTPTMSDREFGGNDDLSLPKGVFRVGQWCQFSQLTRPATVQKIVQDILATEPGMTFAKDSRDLLIECCVEFITLISSEANEIAEKDAKKTIACEHVKAALEELDFGEYVPAILEVAQDYKKQQQVRADTCISLAFVLNRNRIARRSRPRSSRAA